ncbi:hypothetical protein DES40_0817 [Litorimonas taeanensis]|uniref:Uncharacterized protein n=2 Tax=Litorimonas taeanensis TaxID=568099 RepID=A0A420WKS3_9PROT|nr:hypothetical protein DES40_0817 [Litorimonas taeanensis]
MKYLGYCLIVVAIVAGFLAWPGSVVLLLAFLSTLIFATARHKNVKSTPLSLPKNMVLDGVFLFAAQTLIMFTAYLIGIFAVSPGGHEFMNFLSGQR